MTFVCASFEVLAKSGKVTSYTPVRWCSMYGGGRSKLPHSRPTSCAMLGTSTCSPADLKSLTLSTGRPNAEWAFRNPGRSCGFWMACRLQGAGVELDVTPQRKHATAMTHPPVGFELLIAFVTIAPLALCGCAPAQITYEQVGACAMNKNHAWVYFKIHRIDNSQGGTDLDFNPRSLVIPKVLDLDRGIDSPLN